MIDVLEEKLNIVTDKLGYGSICKVIVSNRPELCDFQCDDVFKLAKQYHKNPIEIGEEIVSHVQDLEDFDSYFDKIEFIKPGFINITVQNSFINSCLENMKTKEKFGIKKPIQEELYFLDYGGPNVAKPLHVGHMRTAIVGESIKRIIRYMEHKTICDVHLGDYGLQIGQVIYGILKDNIKEEDITLSYLEDTYPKISALCKEDETVKEKCASITKDLQDGNATYQRLFKIILKISGNDIKRLYRYLGVSFDIWNGESDAYPYIPDTEKYLKSYIVESEGAKIIPLEGLPPLIFRKSNGAYLYATTDLASIYERITKYHPDHILYIVDNRQSLHFEQVFRVCETSNLTKNTKLEFLGYGTVNGMDGKPYKTRSGDAPKLDHLFAQIRDLFASKKETNKDMLEEDIDKIVNAILKFADLQNSREKDYIFDIDKFSNVVGKTGPYILYTYLRIDKILRSESINRQINGMIYNECDRKLRLHLLGLEKALTSSFEERKPHYLVDFIYNTAVLANQFYQQNHITGLENEEKKGSWLYVLELTNQILKEMLELIMIDVPSFM